jgi:3(or 17)beta-hydroxysteroid dehydrogenase
MKRLEGKVALISGGARGIGAQTARLMLEHGAKVVIGDISDEQGYATATTLRKQGFETAYVHLDVTRQDDWTAAVATAVTDFGGLDILVNNAGIFLGKGVEEASLLDCERLCAVNLGGAFLGTKIALPALRQSALASLQGSAIINVSSIAGLVGTAMDPLYSMTKGGITSFTKSTAIDFGRKGYRIRVNSIHPGAIETDMGSQTFASRARALGTDDIDVARRQSLAAHPIGRLGAVDDIASGIVFLASDESGFMTGSSLVVDGGFTAQ